MATKRVDHGSGHADYKKLKKVIFATQSVCGICGQPVNFDKVFPDPWSATLDHIIPVSKGGNPLSIDNAQLAHLQCNRLKATKIQLKNQEIKQVISNRDLPLTFDWSAIGKENE